MAQQHLSPHDVGMAPGVDDAVFDTHPDFNFDEGNGQLPDGMAFDPYADMDFEMPDGMMDGFDDTMHSMQQGEPSNYPPVPSLDWQNPLAATEGSFFPDQARPRNAGAPSSTQQEVVMRRGDSVAQQYGQITPPEDSQLFSPPSEDPEDSGKKVRQERARNAANKRHSKSKQAVARKRSVSQQSDDNDPESVEEADGTDNTDNRQARYREKNRVAAAKCRAKKKTHNDVLEERYRNESALNGLLKRQVRGLRNELAQLKGSALEHDPDACGCQDVHAYSRRQAELFARAIGPAQAGQGSFPPPSGDNTE